MDSEKESQEVKPESKWVILDYGRLYKPLLIIPVLIFLASLVYLVFFYVNTGDVISKDVTLSGGVTLTVFDKGLDLEELRASLSPQFDDLTLRRLTDIATGEQIAITIEAPVEADSLKQAAEDFLGYKLDNENSSTEFTGSALSNSFYKQLIAALLLAFIFMSLTILIIFRSALPSIYVVSSVLMDVVVSLAIVNFMGMKMSAAGIAAFLMLIGYSVDTDILLTTKVLKRRDEPINQRILNAFKTGMTMTVTSLAAVLIAYFLVISPVLKQIFLILSIGLMVDIIPTWVLNTGLLKWSEERRDKQ